MILLETIRGCMYSVEDSPALRPSPGSPCGCIADSGLADPPNRAKDLCNVVNTFRNRTATRTMLTSPSYNARDQVPLYICNIHTSVNFVISIIITIIITIMIIMIKGNTSPTVKTWRLLRSCRDWQMLPRCRVEILTVLEAVSSRT